MLQFKVVHTLLVNAETRDATMSFIAEVLERNAKRSQLQVRATATLTARMPKLFAQSWVLFWK